MTKVELITYFISTDFKEDLLEYGMPMYEVTNTVDFYTDLYIYLKRVDLSDDFFKWIVCTKKFPELIEMFSNDDL